VVTSYNSLFARAHEVEVFTLSGGVTELGERLSTICDRVEAGGVRPVLHLEGVQGAFASGSAMDWPEQDLSIRTVTRWERALRRLERVPAASVVVVTGEVGPAALEVLLCTDWRICATDSVLGLSAPAWPGAGLFRMARQLGHTTTRRLTLFPGALPASRALDLGLVDEVRGGSIADVLDAGTSAARAIVLDDADVAVLRQLHNEAATAQYDDAIGAHLAACDRLLRRRTAGDPT
jgi:isomerase DpgB